MRIVGEALGPMVPGFDYLGQPSAAFPYPFVGYRRLPGDGADQIESLDQAALTWLAEARAQDPDAVSKHVTWVRRAFAG